MRTTWIILLLTAAAAAGLYFYFTQKAKPAAYDTIAILGTQDSILQKIKVFVAEDPFEVFYRDSTWSLADSTPLKQILVNGTTDSISKSYKEKTFYITYNDQFFYDMEIRKADSGSAFRIDLQVVPVGDSMYLQGTIDQSGAGLINFKNPMANTYRSFVITYSDRRPDSLKLDTTIAAPKTQATKIITVLRP